MDDSRTEKRAPQSYVKMNLLLPVYTEPKHTETNFSYQIPTEISVALFNGRILFRPCLSHFLKKKNQNTRTVIWWSL